MAKQKKEKQPVVVELSPEELKKQLDDLKILYSTEKTTLNATINTLNKKIERKNEENTKLELKINELNLIIEARIEDNRAILEQSSIDRKKTDQTVDVLLTTREELTKQLENLKDDFSESMKEISKNRDQQVIDLKKELNLLKQTCQELDEFKKTKQLLEEENNNLKKEIRKLKDENFLHLMNLKKEHEEELKTQEQNLIEGFTHEKQAIIKSTDDHLSKKTIHTMQKNIQLKEKIEQNSHETGKILSENRRLEEENRHLKHETNVEKSSLEEMSKKLNSYLKTIKSLSIKIKEMEHEKHVDTPTREKYKNYSIEELTKIVEDKDVIIERFKRETESYKEKLESYRKSMSKYETQIQTEDEIGKFILQTMQDIKLGYWKENGEEPKDVYNKKKSDQWKSKDLIPMNLTKLSTQERETLFSFLLSKLHTFDRKNIRKEINFDSSPNSSPSINNSNINNNTNNTINGRIIDNNTMNIRNSADSPTFTLPPIHYHVTYKQRLSDFRKKSEKF